MAGRKVGSGGEVTLQWQQFYLATGELPTINCEGA